MLMVAGAAKASLAQSSDLAQEISRETGRCKGANCEGERVGMDRPCACAWGLANRRQSQSQSQSPRV